MIWFFCTKLRFISIGDLTTNLRHNILRSDVRDVPFNLRQEQDEQLSFITAVNGYIDNL